MPRPSRRRALASLAAVSACLFLGGCHALARGALLAAVHPARPFDPATAPVAPDYGTPSAWAARPESPDNADLAPPGARPEAQADAAADCFFVHGTTWASRAGWNEPPGDAAADGYTDRDVLPGQAGAFNAACRVYAPRYRQANLYAFVDPVEGAAALDLAYGDIARAFEVFLDRIGPDRPFLLAGHSQGSLLLLRLLAQRLSGGPLVDRLVAAYLPGWGIGAADLARMPDIPLCAGPTQSGCLATWNSEGEAPRGQLVDLTGPDTACLNPLSWRTGPAEARASAAQASWRWSWREGEPLPPVVAGELRARCADGALVVAPVDRPFRNGFAEDALLGRAVLHNVDYALFYGSIRENALQRVEAWLAQR